MKKKSLIGIGIGVIVAIAIIAIAIGSSNPQVVKTMVPFVTVTGSASTIGGATKPISIDFTSDAGSTTSVNVVNGTYSITLPNQHSYSTTVHYSAGYGLTSGTCDAGSLSIYTNMPTMDRSISC